MPRWLLDRDPLSGVEQYYIPTPDGKGFTLETIQDVEPILEHNKRLQNGGFTGYTPSRDMKHVATIPPIIELRWKREYGIDINDRNHWPAVKRLLNSNEWRWLRTSPGTI